MQKNNEKGYVENVKGFKHVHGIYSFKTQKYIIWST
jgi:hypothetical protein